MSIKELPELPIVKIRSDCKPVNLLTGELVRVISEYFENTEPSPSSLVEVLNAVANTAGVIIYGASPTDNELLGWFHKLVDQQVQILRGECKVVDVDREPQAELEGVH